MTTTLSPEFLALQQLLAGRYSIERELGRGGMGIVLLARDVALDRLVAIKLLPPALAADPDYRARFLQEARTAAGLSHPNIVPIHLVEAHGDLVFFVMSYVEGETLRERVERAGPLTPRFATKLMQEVAWGLAYAHQRGVIHRDIKPDNIMIEQGTDRALLTDFGIAVRGRAANGGTGEVIGTARYMSPEQALGETVDGRSDLYSLGATLFYALTGRAPFTGANLPAVLAQQVSQPAPALATVRPGLPTRLAAVIDECLQKAPEARPQTGDELARILGEARGRDYRAPPLVRSFVRNAQVTTMVFVAAAFAGQVQVGSHAGNVTVVGFGPGLIGIVLIAHLVRVARRLLREGYAFEDIRTALLAEAQVQEEESQVIQQRRWTRRLDTLWHKLWAGKFGRWFFRVAGAGLKRPERRALASHDATELVLAHSARAAYDALPAETRRQARGVPEVVEALESRAESLRARGETGEPLTETVAALENLRLALLKLGRGLGSVDDLTAQLARAKDIGERVERQIAAQQEVAGVLGRGAGGTA